MDKGSKIYIAGHIGLVGSALMRYLSSNGYHNLILKSLDGLDLRDQLAVNNFFEEHSPEYVFLAAARVGGIKANMDSPAEFIYDNLMINNNVIDASYRFNVKKLLVLGSSCIYPRMAKQPIKEEYLLSGPLEKTNEPYAIAKIAGLKMCEAYNRQYQTNFISCMPTNLYGPNDNFDLNTSHVLPALISKFYQAKINGNDFVELWGSGLAKREFLYVDDLARALVFLMNNYQDNTTINVGTGEDVTIRELALMIQDVVGFEGKIVFDTSKPDGTPRKVLDVSKINDLGWKANTSLRDGIIKTYDWFTSNKVLVKTKMGSQITN